MLPQLSAMHMSITLHTQVTVIKQIYRCVRVRLLDLVPAETAEGRRKFERRFPHIVRYTHWHLVKRSVQDHQTSQSSGKKCAIVDEAMVTRQKIKIWRKSCVTLKTIHLKSQCPTGTVI